MTDRFRTRAELLRVADMLPTPYEHALKRGMLVPARPAPTPADVHLYDDRQVMRWAVINRVMRFGLRMRDAVAVVPPLVGWYRDDRAVLVIRQDRPDDRLALDSEVVSPSNLEREMRASGDIVLVVDLPAIRARVEAALEAQG